MSKGGDISEYIFCSMQNSHWPDGPGQVDYWKGHYIFRQTGPGDQCYFSNVLSAKQSGPAVLKLGHLMLNVTGSAGQQSFCNS
jgi:hypothetical protein